MKKLLGRVKKSGSPERNGGPPTNLPQGDAPEAVVVREVTAFCESGAPNAPNAGDEYLHLPAIVDAAESSPTAAREAAACIRRYLAKEHYSRGFAQYNAIMLMRILTDNPAHVFTQNFDKDFISTTKQLLREGKDPNVQQIMRETLDHFEFEKMPGNDTLMPLVEMWRKEKGKTGRLRPSVGLASFGTSTYESAPADPEHQYNRAPPPIPRHQSQRRRDVLPPPEELASRIEEAKTTARLLVQTVQSTPQSELLANDLVKEFADRARAAQKSVQNFLNCQNPAPDPDTMLTLIETNDQLNIAMSKHQRSVLQARRAAGEGTPTTSPHPSTEPMQNPLFQPQQPQHQLGQNVYGSQQPQSPQPLVDYGQNDTPPRTQSYAQSYGQSQRPESDLYSSSPPARQGVLGSPVSPVRREERFSPPPGPPPAALGAVRNQSSHPSPPPPSQPLRSPQSPSQQYYDYSEPYAGYAAPSGPPPNRTEYAAPAPPAPIETEPKPSSASKGHGRSVSHEYGIADNPFADDGYGDSSPDEHRTGGLFSRSDNPPATTQPMPGYANQPVSSAAPPGNYQPPDQTGAYTGNPGSPAPDTQPGGLAGTMNDLQVK